jgi:hypothetical protein
MRNGVNFSFMDCYLLLFIKIYKIFLCIYKINEYCFSEKYEIR